MIFRLDNDLSEKQWRVFLDQGACGWCGVKRLDALDHDPRMEPVREQRLNDSEGEALPFHRSDLQAVVWDAASSKAALVGFLRQRYGWNKVDVVPNRDANDIEEITAWQAFDSEIPAGETQPLDPLIVSQGDDPYELLEQFGEAVREHHGRRFDGPPIVGMMTWYGYRTAIDEDIVLGNSRIIGELFSGYPQPMQKLMLLDHGWNEDANWGYWQPDQKRFSHGMKWLSDRLAQDGLDMGLWYTPFCISRNAPNMDEILPLQSLDGEGKPFEGVACVWGDLPGHDRGLQKITFFDAGLDAVQDKWRSEFADMRDWGTRYWKLDFFALQTSLETSRTLGVGELWNRSFNSWREVIGDDMHLAPCSCSTNLQIGYCDSVRIGSDIGNAGHWPGAYEQFRYGLATIPALWYKNRKFWINDADSVQIAKGCSLPEARVRATVVALSGGHFMLSEDLREVDQERIEMIRRLIPPYPEAARPLNLFENPFPEGYPNLWSLKLDTGFGPMTVLAVFNLSRQTQTFEITPEMLGIDDGREFLALEWWQYKWLGKFNEAFTVDVPAEDVYVIHAQPIRDVPSIISISHHITGGYIVEDSSFDESSGTLSATIAAKPGLRMTIFGQIPEGWGLSRETQFHGVTNSLGGFQYEVLTTAGRTQIQIGFDRK